MATSRVRSFLLASAVLVAVAACGAGDTPTAADPAAPSGPRHLIDDWGRWGSEGFYFLPGTPPPGNVDGPFESGVQPTVSLCRLTSGVCGSTIASWTRTSGSYSRTVSVSTSGRSYNVTWPTASTGVSSGQIYRITVVAAGRTLGFQDVQIVSSTSAGAAVDTSQYKWVVRNNNYPISFRINQGVPASITLSSSSLSMSVADGRTISVSMVDLVGNAMSTADAGWEIENTSAAPGPVAVLDSGMVIGKHAGTATLWAWWGPVMTSIPITVTDSRHAWTVMTTPDTEQNRALWGASATNIFAANNTGILRYNGTSWSHVPEVRWRTMNDVWGSAANNVWAVGDDGIILRYNGTAWSAFRFNGTAVVPFDLNSWAPTSGPHVKLRRIAPVPSTTLMAVTGDGGYVLAWDGSAWDVMNTGDDDAVTGIWGTGYTNMYITRGDGRLQRFNGSTLSTVTLVTAPGAMNAVWGTSASNVYAAGDGGMLYRYNGSTWSRIRLPTRGSLYTVYGTSATNVFVAGSDGALYRYNGTTWTPEKVTAGDPQNFGMWATSGGQLYLAGAGGLIARR